MAKEKMKRKQAVIERQEEELESREQSLEGAAAQSQQTTKAADQLLQESNMLKVLAGSSVCKLEVECGNGGKAFNAVYVYEGSAP